MDILLRAGLVDVCHASQAAAAIAATTTTTTPTTAIPTACANTEPTSYNNDGPDLAPPLRLDYALTYGLREARGGEAEINNITALLSDHYPINVFWPVMKIEGEEGEVVGELDLY